MLTYSQRAMFARNGASAVEAEIAVAKKVLAAQAEAESAARRAEYERITAPVPFTPEELKSATHIRTSAGWHKVVRVNAKSVTVETGYSWTDRHSLGTVLEVRAVGTR